MFPNDRSVTRMVRTGGLSKPELLAEFQKRGIELNDAGNALFAHSLFTTSATISVVETVEIPVVELGYQKGATTAQIHERAVRFGLSLCPLELGPHLRLQFLDQPEGFWGHPPSIHRAPPGSITVASHPLTQDDDDPKGFYLRCIKGVLWLRGYRCTAQHIWNPEDRLIFCVAHDTVRREIPADLAPRR